MQKEAPVTTTKCPHCKGNTESGIHNGCEKCGKVKHTSSGRREYRYDR